MRKWTGIMLACAVALALADRSFAQCRDVNQPSGPAYMKGFNQTDCAQSFKPTVTQLSGAGAQTQPGVGVNGAVTIQLWANGLPGQGGSMIATGTDPSVNAGEWAEVRFGGCVTVTRGQTYYLVFTNDNNTLGLAGDTNNPYPDGNVYANPGFNPFPTFDYTFYTACDCQGETFCEAVANKVKAKRCQDCPAPGVEKTNKQCDPPGPNPDDCPRGVKAKGKITTVCPSNPNGKCIYKKFALNGVCDP